MRQAGAKVLILARRVETRTALKSATRCKPVQLSTILPRRELEPALAGAKETPLIGETEHIGRLRKRQIEPAEILLRQFAPGVVQQLHERRGFRLEPALQRALAQA